MPIQIHKNFLKAALCLYLIATWTSMAGMEIFGWLTFALTISYAFRLSNSSAFNFTSLSPVLPWKTMIAIVGITVVGIFVNGVPEADKVFVIGSQRWVFLLVSASLALTFAPPTLKGYKVFLAFTGVIAVYAIFQSFSGIDLLRPGSNRAVQPLDVATGVRLWRSAGMFGSPMGYVYIVGMHACLPLAAFFLLPKQLNRLRWISLGVFLVIAFSLVTTYVRGGWIAMAIAYFVMAALVSRRLAAYVASGLTLGAAILIGVFPQVRARAFQLFDLNYSSNSDRLLLWKANLMMFRDYPLLGVGYSVNEDRAREYVTKLGYPDAFTGHAHNNYLQWLAGTGILGFLAYMFFIGFFIWITLRLYRRIPAHLYWPRILTLATLGAQIQLHVGGFTECNFKAGATNHNFMIVLGLVASISLLERSGLLESAYGLPLNPTEPSAHGI